ncbi:hypothetical protein KTD55_33115 [Burkholderia gladioli]|uniref:hypothetical protein n=1 Tax=Burkholderia gladioli TaxID=28095 RepID=UPI001C231438|nr:hypothetical protein [Burkholderia gladioli]MBU9218899.1 hypothetical protein [Burkholderia gladioli]MBW5287210.1 hypothetical protein [Burkholderia gladioli]
MTAPVEYDRSRLWVWPEWGSSGIWYPQMGSQLGHGGVSMVAHAALGLPDALSERFSRWIDWYDEYMPENPDQFPWPQFRQEGQELAFELARFVGSSYSVEYAG